MIDLQSYQPGTREWLHQVVTISWFTDARLPEGEPVLDQDRDRRGHWGDLFADENTSVGSLLWTLRRRKMTPDTINRARDIATDALQWLLATPYVTAVQVEAQRLDNFILALQATLTLSTGAQQIIKESFNAA